MNLWLLSLVSFGLAMANSSFVPGFHSYMKMLMLNSRMIFFKKGAELLASKKKG